MISFEFQALTLEDINLKIECLEDFAITKLADFRKDVHVMRTTFNKRLDDLEKNIDNEILNRKRDRATQDLQQPTASFTEPHDQIVDSASDDEGESSVVSKKRKLEFVVPQKMTDLDPEVGSKLKKYQSTFKFWIDREKLSYAQSLYFYAWVKENNVDQKLTGISFFFHILCEFH